ncbi:MAG: bifunctional riboflavin kinase/FAD synthetase [Flavobacteriales bacterium]
MNLIYGIDSLPPLAHPMVTIGTFDGVHEGHKKILHSLCEKAKSKGVDSMLITFEPHPRKALGLENLSMLSVSDEKMERLNSLPLDYVLVLPFTKAFSELSAATFIQTYLIDRLNISEIVLGYDHKFGNQREGNVELLKEILEPKGIEVTEIPAQNVDEIIISSTKIRKALAAGDLQTANRLLGYSYSLQGNVVLGNQKGRTLGFPTANIALSNEEKLIPGRGVYLVDVALQGTLKWGMMNIGIRPTLTEDEKITLEVHLLDFNADIYGEEVRVRFLEKIREEFVFSGPEALIEQLKKDEALVRRSPYYVHRS